MTTSNQSESIGNNQVMGMHHRAKEYMTAEHLQELVKENQGKIFVGAFVEDFTDGALALAESLDTTEASPTQKALFNRHFGHVKNATETQLTEIIIPDLRVRLNQALNKVSTHNKLRLIELAKAYELCNTRLLDLSASK
jgi:hypothetical protein